MASRACVIFSPRIDPERGIAIVPMGLFDDCPPRAPQEHIYVGSKADWYDIPGELPQYPEGPPS